MGDINKILQMTPENLAAEQYNLLKEDTVEVLRSIAILIQQDRLDEVSELLEHSPAGDCMGTDSEYIAFKSVDGDIGDVIDRLKRLKELNNG